MSIACLTSYNVLGFANFTRAEKSIENHDTHTMKKNKLLKLHEL